MSTAVIKPKPGIYNGVKYRSQLEIAWAKWIEHWARLNANGYSIEYADAHGFDFALKSSWRTVYVEIKPLVVSACITGMENIPMDKAKDGDVWLLVIGNPPSCYSLPITIRLRFFCATQLFGRCSELGALLTFGRMHDEMLIGSNFTVGSCGWVMQELIPVSDWIGCSNKQRRAWAESTVFGVDMALGGVFHDA